MKRNILLDTGVLVTFINKREKLHLWTNEQWKKIEPPLYSQPEFLPAIERYNGVAFRVVRKFLQEQTTDYLDIFILSAKFGLIPAYQLIPNYDQKMDRVRSQELKPLVNVKFNEL
ncbi:hypothetical protein PL11201_690120 [Planktothrix sp. PCC 11201]|uniref:DUF6884 domain-containing protein n=1 Tax=Planktothrix sp. PCC 11201 TaxID=1729650 RepID=UPI00091A330D|nr:DUF6884 domain-containing protein [Planktothrix sp. PCC 11201]SKB15099.1 hypothetical protein PL11201_690120 [Planktothrix sp. PCC 11201]